MTNYLSVLSSVAIGIFIISALPQIWKLWRTKSSRDISIGMAFLIASGNTLMLIRSIGIHDTFFVVNYIFQLTLWVLIIILALKYSGK